ncbi:MAG: TlpA family protein disulfide reductase [Anaerolineales bacterium]
MEEKTKRNWLPLLGIGLLIGLGLGLAIIYGFDTRGVFSPGGRPASESAQVGSEAPDFELETLTDSTIRLSSLKGKPVLINFWATWCAPCVLEMPNFQKYYEQYPGSFEVLAVNYGESRDTVERFVKDIGVTFPVLFDNDAKVHGMYRFPGYPTSYFVDKDGIVRFQHIGLMDESTLEGYLSKIEALQ